MGRWNSAPLLPLAGLLTLCCCSPREGAPRTPGEHLGHYPESDIVHPVKVDGSGSFLTYDLSYRAISKRNLGSPDSASSRLYYGFNYGGQELRLNLSANPSLLAPGFVFERRYGGIAQAQIQHKAVNTCYLLGEIQGRTGEMGQAALSACDGLRGVFQLSKDDYFIEPLAGASPGDSATAGGNVPRPHRVYRRHVPERREAMETGRNVSEAERNQRRKTCGVKDSVTTLDKTEKRRESWDRKQKKRRSRESRSVSKEKWVEALVVADTKMVEYHGSKNVEHYILTVMNMVAGLFHDPSIGNPINIVIVRLVLLEEEEEDLKITHHADNTLKSFCKWQKMVNIKGDSHPTHHDVAILITRRDICAAMNRPCETLGLSHVSGMCQPHRSCNINEDTGLPLAFTIAHELGHSFGIQHDGTGNDCEPVGKRPFIMSPQLLYDTSPLTWSRCSRDYITRFLDRGWGLCLDDPPTKERLNYPSVPPGVLYDVGHQCRLQYGALSTFCQDIDNVCNTLWCTVGITCHSKLDAAVDGTKCGEDKWCFNGDCVDVGYRPGSINGAWGLWGLWSTCSRTCGAGVQYAERQCSNPTPKYGGKYCLGERKRYRICNIKPCTTNTPSFRQVQCMRFDSVLYKGKVHTWTPVHNMVNPCELHCRPEGEFFSEKLLDAVIDGTPCYEGNASRDMCINGICKNVGCDYEIDSGAVEDRCGVCHGNASTCQTVKKTFEESEGLGYVDIGLIPPGAREIRIEEVAEAGNFLALRGEDPENYFLNGGWTIQWNGDYSVAGTTFTYQRQGDLENLTSPGPTREPVWIQLLFQETNPGVRFQYVIHRELDEENEIPPPDFSWRYGSWTKCTATCGTGVQRQIALCVEKLSGIVEEKYCDSQSRPDDQQRECSREPCPARWWVGEWQACTATCGESGLARRTALCLQSVALDEQRALPASECQHLPKPDSSAPCNRGTPCPANWGAGNWSACSSTCGTGKKWRPVYCSNNTQAACSISQRPESEATCSLPPCPKRPVTTGPDWSGSGAASRELFNEIYHIPGHPVPKGIPTSPKHQGENVIPENGFISGHNKKNGVRGNGNPVVDDFYYDYNFINFHEDLSYDLPGERIGTPTESHEPKVKSEAARDHQHLPTPPSLHNSEGVFHPVDPTGKEAADDVRTPGASGTNLETQTKNGVFAMTKSLIEVTVSQTTSAVPYLKDEKDESETLLSGDLPLLEKQDTLQNSSDSSAENEHPGTWSIPAGSPEDAQVTDMLPHVSHTTLLPPADNVYTSSNGRLGEPRKQDNESSVVMGGSHSESHDTVNDTKDEAGTDQSADSPLTGNLFGNDFTQLPEEDLESEEVPENIQHQPDPHIHPTSTPTWRVPSSSGKYLAHPTALGIKKETDSRWSSPWTDQMQSRVDIDQERPDVHASNKQVYDIVLGTTTFRPVLSTASHGDQASVANSRALMSPAINNHNTESSNEHPSYDWSNFILTADPALQTSPSSLYQRGTTSWPASNEIHLSSDLEDHLLPTTSYNWETLGTGERPTSLPGEGSPEMPTSGEDKKLAPVMPSPLTQEGSGPSEPTSSTERQITADKARWEVGNWSQCSTTCGLGAIWRTVECSAGKDHRCDAATKPVPARRCYLRPCSFWHVGNWTKCSKNCGGGTTVRDVHCIDTRDQRLLRPFHCQAMLYKPPSQALCQPKPCMDWYTSSWRECSEACGGGAQERLVTCPEFGRCEDSARPNSTRPCGTQPCTKWVVGSWGQCTASCGGGIQRRLVKCVNTKTGDTEEDSSLCEHEVWPDNTQKCNPQDCEHTESSFICERDRLTFSFCQTLRILGRCHLPTVKVQCCRTCHPLSPGTRDRGNERASRR